MAIPFQQQDTAAPCGSIQACAAVAPAADADARLAEKSGTAGTTELACDVAPGSSELCYADELAIADDDSLDAGDLTARLNITTAQGDLTLEDIYVCRLDSSCTSQETLGSATGLGLDVSAGGVFSQVVTLSAASAHDPGDVVYITYAFANAHTHTTRAVAITPDQIIDTPWTETTSGTTEAISATLAGTSLDSAPASLTEHTTATLAGVSVDTGTPRTADALSATLAGVSVDTGAAQVVDALSATLAGVSTDAGTPKTTDALSATLIGTSDDTAVVSDTAPQNPVSLTYRFQPTGWTPEPAVSPVHVEDFSSYTDTTDLRSGSTYLSDASNNEDLIFLDTSESVSGGQSMRYDFTAKDTCGNRTISKEFDLPALLGTGYTEVWLEITAKLSANFHTGEPNNGGVGLNSVSGTFQVGESVSFSGGDSTTILGVQSQAAGDGTEDEVYLTISQIASQGGPAQGETATGGTSGATGTVADAHLGCDTNSDYKFLLLWADGAEGTKRFSLKHGNAGDRTSSTYPGNDFSRDLNLRTGGANFNSVEDFFDGEWHTYRMHWALEDPVNSGAANGISKIWIDGEMVRDWTDLDTTDHTELQHLDIGANRNAPANELMQVWWDEIKVWDTDPGWDA